MKYKRVTLGAAAVTTGLSAGLFYAYSVSVNPAFATLPDGSYIAAMQAIDTAIENPVFFLSFFGAAIALPLAAYQHRNGTPRAFKALVVASVLYVIGTFGVTAAVNVPLNKTLNETNVATATPAELGAAREQYVGPWNSWHAVRTVAATGALIAVAVACLTATPGKRNEQ